MRVDETVIWWEAASPRLIFTYRQQHISDKCDAEVTSRTHVHPSSFSIIPISRSPSPLVRSTRGLDETLPPRLVTLHLHLSTVLAPPCPGRLIMTAPNPGSDEEWLLFRLEQAHDLAAFQSKVEQDRVEFSRNIEAARQKLLVEQQLREQNFWSNRESNKRDIPQRDATSATAPTKQTARVNVPVTGSDRHRDVVVAKNESTAQIQVNGGSQTPAVESNTAHAKKTASKRMTTTTKPDPRPEKPAPTFIDLCSDDEEEADAINVCTADLPAKTGTVSTKPAQSAMRKNDDDVCANNFHRD